MAVPRVVDSDFGLVVVFAHTVFVWQPDERVPGRLQRADGCRSARGGESRGQPAQTGQVPSIAISVALHDAIHLVLCVGWTEILVA